MDSVLLLGYLYVLSAALLDRLEPVAAKLRCTDELADGEDADVTTLAGLAGPEAGAHLGRPHRRDPAANPFGRVVRDALDLERLRRPADVMQGVAEVHRGRGDDRPRRLGAHRHSPLSRTETQGSISWASGPMATA